MKNINLGLKSVKKCHNYPLKSVLICLFYGLKSVICVKKIGLKSVEETVEKTDITAIIKMEAKREQKASINLRSETGREKLDYGRIRQNAVFRLCVCKF